MPYMSIHYQFYQQFDLKCKHIHQLYQDILDIRHRIF